MVQIHRFWMGGESVDSGETAVVTNPYTGSEAARIYRPDAAQLEAGVNATVSGHAAMKKLPAHERARLLDEVAHRLESETDDAARMLALEAGKPMRHALAEVKRAVNTLRLSAIEAQRLYGEVIPMDLTAGGAGKSAMVSRFPLGPILGITPFNFPLNLVCHKVGPAVAAGNAILIKPASATPLSALRLARLFHEAGAPAGAVNVLPVSGAMVSPLVEDARFDMVTFTGSAEVGWSIKDRAGRKKVCLELGGNAAVVVEPDADMRRAVDRCVLGAYAYAGQVCISVQRILVARSVFDDFLHRFTESVSELVIGDPLLESTQVGPMIDEENARRTVAWIEEAVARGASCLMGGSRDRNMVTPAVLTGTQAHDRVWRQEAFAPLAVVEVYDDFQEALQRVNDSDFGLQAGVFTQNISKAHAAYAAIDAGGVIINDVPTFRVDHMPYGGIKASGFGREGVRYAIEEMTEPKLMVIHHDQD